MYSGKVQNRQDFDKDGKAGSSLRFKLRGLSQVRISIEACTVYR